MCSVGSTLGKISNVELIGTEVSINFVQDKKGLTIMPGEPVKPVPGITDSSLAGKYSVLRITHDKDWINDDDPGVVAPGWFRKCNLGTGDFNNDLTISDVPGEIWSYTFSGSSAAVSC